jgi:hypothetical protein
VNFLTPLAGVLLAAAIIPPLVALYFLKLRRQKRTVASTLLWKRSVEDLRANAPFQRLRPNLLLFLQLLVIGLVAFALAQPQVDAGLVAGGRTVLLIDRSASMNATDVATEREPALTRLGLAKREAASRVERLFGGGLFAGGAEVMVIAFADRAEVRIPFSDNRAAVLEAIRAIEPTDGATRVGEALQLARAFTLSANPDEVDPASLEPPALELYSDGRIADLGEQAIKPGEVVRYRTVGTATPRNLAIVGVAAERSPESPDRIQVFGALANTGGEAASADLQLSVDGAVRALTPKPVEVAALEIGKDPGDPPRVPGREQVVFLPFAQPRDAVIEVAQLTKDDLAVDDAAALVVPPAKRLRVAMVGGSGGPGFATRSVLEGMALEGLVTLSAAEFEALVDSGETDRHDVYVIENHVPRDGKPLPPGRYLTFGGVPLAGLNPYGENENAYPRTNREDHPIFRFVTLDDLFVSKLQAIAPSRDFEVLAEASTGPMIVAHERGGVRVLHVAFDPLDSNWPFLRSFVNFVPNALEWLGSAGDALANAGLRPGETVSIPIPARAESLSLRLPDGTVVPVASRGTGEFSYGPLRTVGIYEASWTEPGRDGRQSRRFAVNLLDPAESDLAAAAELPLGNDLVTGRAVTANARSSLWPWVLGLSLALVLFEWWVYQRRAA